MNKWQVQEAKAHLSEVIARAISEGPQLITKHGTEQAVVLSIETYKAMVANQPNVRTLLLGGPKFDDFLIERERDEGREVEL